MKITVDNICKSFRDKTVVEKLSFTASPGKILGLLGPNGAGKTTTLRMLLDILKPDEGEIRFDGNPVDGNMKDRMGYLPEERGLYPKTPVIDLLIYLGRLKGMTGKKAQIEAVRLVDRFGMIDQLDEPVNHLSKGFQQKVQLMCAMIHDPDVLIFDEPFYGLDPLNQETVRKILRLARKGGKTIVLSTHQMNEAEDLCDEILLINHGKDVLRGSLEQIRSRFRENLITVKGNNNLAQLRQIQGIKKAIIKDEAAHLYVDPNVPPRVVIEKIVRLVHISQLEVNQPRLNDIFLEVVQNGKGKSV